MTVTGAEDCAFNLTDVTGPNGQVNHGTVVSNFVQALKDSELHRVPGLHDQDHRPDRLWQGRRPGEGVGDHRDHRDDRSHRGDGIPPTFTVTDTTCGKPDNPGKSNEEHGKSGESHGKSQESHGRPESPGHSGEHGNPNS